jgi:hypothetical protein
MNGPQDAAHMDPVTNHLSRERKLGSTSDQVAKAKWVDRAQQPSVSADRTVFIALHHENSLRDQLVQCSQPEGGQQKTHEPLNGKI